MNNPLPAFFKPRVLVPLAVAGLVSYHLVKHPPFAAVPNGEFGIRINQLTGGVTIARENTVFVLPVLHSFQTRSQRDQHYQNERSAYANGDMPYQSLEGLPVGIALDLAYALDPDHLAPVAQSLPDDIATDLIAPTVHKRVSKIVARYSVSEIYTTKRNEVQQAIEDDLRHTLAERGIAVREVTMGKVDLPSDYFRDQVYHDTRSARANGESAFQSIEGLSIGVDIAVRYALDPARLAAIAHTLPSDIGSGLIEPTVHGIVYKTFSRYTVREIFSSKRAEIQQAIEAEIKPKLAADGIVVRDVMLGKVDLPSDYKANLEQLLNEELATEKMRYTLELKEKQVKQTELEGQADAVRREKAAEAAANEQIIAAKAQEESMKHILPFKEKQVQQRQLEADAEKIARIKNAEAEAEAHKIETAAEADSRQKLADAEAYRIEVTGKASTAQLVRDGEVISKHPLLIQKTMADKLSDKISVIIAPPNTNGFVGNGLLGGNSTAKGE